MRVFRVLCLLSFVTAVHSLFGENLLNQFTRPDKWQNIASVEAKKGRFLNHQKR